MKRAWPYGGTIHASSGWSPSRRPAAAQAYSAASTGLRTGWVRAALRRGVAVVPGRLLSTGAGGSSHVRLAFTGHPDRLAAAAAALAEV